MSEGDECTQLRFLLACNIKDEKNYQEWILYHIAQGWTHILLFDDMSSEYPPTLSSTWIDFDKITLVQKHLRKIQYMKYAVQFGKQHGYDYLLYLDMDEYLVLTPPHTSLSTFFQHLLEIHYRLSNPLPRFPQAVHFHWLFFGSSGRDDIPHSPLQLSLISVYQKSAERLDIHVKMMAKISDIVQPLNPHIYLMTCHRHAVHLSTNGFPTSVRTARYPTRFLLEKDQVLAYIAHYHVQCWTEFCRRRRRVRDDSGTLRQYPYPLTGSHGPIVFHQQYNQISNTQVFDVMKQLLPQYSTLLSQYIPLLSK